MLSRSCTRLQCRDPVRMTSPIPQTVGEVADHPPTQCKVGTMMAGTISYRVLELTIPWIVPREVRRTRWGLR